MFHPNSPTALRVSDCKSDFVKLFFFLGEDSPTASAVGSVTPTDRVDGRAAGCTTGGRSGSLTSAAQCGLYPCKALLLLAGVVQPLACAVSRLD